ncbi:MAG: hypothetical protein AAGD28_04000 [Bacteroidota bacterium]
MFKKLKKWAESIQAMQPQFDPSIFNDPIASQTEWGPLKGGGSNFKTHILKDEGPMKMAFRATTGMILFSAVFFCVGAGLLIGFGGYKFYTQAPFEWMDLFLGLFGLVFASVGAFLYFSSTQPIIFDKGHGYFYKGRKNTDRNSDKPKVKHLEKLENIHALQLIEEYNSSSDSSYYSYEINLILKDAKRINVIDHGNLFQVREDANTLAAFLKVPVWDAITR